MYSRRKLIPDGSCDIQRSKVKKKKDLVGVRWGQGDRRRVREGRDELGGNEPVGEDRRPGELMLWVSIMNHGGRQRQGLWNYGGEMQMELTSFGKQIRIKFPSQRF